MLSVGGPSTADHPQWHLRSLGFTFGIIAFFTRLLTIIYIFGNSLSECSSMIFIELLWESFDVKEGGPSGTWTHDLRLPCLRSYQLSYRSDQWNWSIRDSLYSLYSSIIQLYSGIHTVIELLDYTYLFWGNAFRTIVGLIAYQLGDQVPLTTRNDISAPSDLHFGIIAFFTRLLTIIYIFGNSLSECSSMIFIEILWESFDVKEGGLSGTWIHDLRLSVPTLLPTELSVRKWNWSIRDSLYSLYSANH